MSKQDTYQTALYLKGREVYFIINSLIFSVLIILSSGISAETKNYGFMDSDIESDSLCGGAESGVNPCLYVTSINFYVYGRTNSDELVKIAGLHVKEWIVANKNFFNSVSVEPKLFMDSALAWYRKPQKRQTNIEVSIFIEDLVGRNEIAISFYSFSRSTFNITTMVCSTNDLVGECISNSIDMLFKNNIVYSLTKFRNI